jgi:L-ascorbate 6-phosphate lactonase
MRDIAYWPRTFLDELEQFPVRADPVLWALGGPSFLYRTAETSIWIDPYFGGTPDDAVPGAYRAIAIPIDPAEIRKADIVISTHDHVDHCHEATVMPIVCNTDAICIAPKSSAKLMRAWGVPETRLREVTVGESFRLRDVEISVGAAYDPNEPDAVTFVLESSGVTLFVSGDTSPSPALADLGARRSLDYALLAFGRTWYMNEEQLIEAARDLSPGTLLPFHWEFWRNHTGDIVRLVEIYQRERPPFELKIILAGDSVTLTKRESAPR